MKSATQQRIQEAREANISLWVRGKTGGVVGYLTPDGRLIRLANAGLLYARMLARRGKIEEVR